MSKLLFPIITYESLKSGDLSIILDTTLSLKKGEINSWKRAFVDLFQVSILIRKLFTVERGK